MQNWKWKQPKFIIKKKITRKEIADSLKFQAILMGHDPEEIPFLKKEKNGESTS